MIPALADIRAGGKAAVARALALIETAEGTRDLARLLDRAASEPRAHVLGMTGPPGVGKSTLTQALIRRDRAARRTVAVVAVDPSSRRSGGALLGDRTRLRTDPDDTGVFVRSMAARDRLGGLSDHAVAAIALLRAVFDRVIVETVGVGQSEGDVAAVADTVTLLIQPGSGDSLQFMKAGIMELPDVIAVTKADLGQPARRARADVEGALGLSALEERGWRVPVVLLSAATGEGLDRFTDAVAAHETWASASRSCDSSRGRQPRLWVADAIRARFGSAGLAAVDLDAAIAASGGPFAAIQAIGAALAARLGRGL